MIKSFADKLTEAVFLGASPKGFPAELLGRTRRALRRIHAASAVTDLRVPPSFRLHQLKGARAGRWSISVNDQFRITFAFEDGHAHDVKFEDYH
ncbi:MAG: type II toxin-antitoxin system RelE/ParE family toxin [Maricaulaceae bacterium]|nr:type II toxin-antitoxin system RelE/ParE family toxin [Maricaulaceae bacterium]